MPTVNLTHKFLVGVTAPEGKRVTWHDEGLPDFGVRVSGTTGTKTFFVRYRNSEGKRRQKKLGRFPTVKLAKARKAAKRTLSQAAHGADPVAEQRTDSLTVEDFSETYIEKYAKPNKRSWAEDQRQLDQDILPLIGHLPMSEVGRSDLVAVLDRVATRGARVQANRVRATLSKLFRFALDRGVIELSPAQGLPRYAKERRRERVLSAKEVRAFWAALGPELPAMAGAFRVALLTGQRMGEVMGMAWNEVEDGWWYLPGERTKNRKDHSVPLSEPVLEILAELKSRRRRKPTAWVFPSPRGGHLVTTKGCAARIRERTGIDDFRPHDLRRTAATGLADLGTPRLVLMKILNHTDPSVSGVYDRYSYADEKREALEAWGERVQQILSGGDPP